MKMFETHENEIGQKVSKRVGKFAGNRCRGMSIAQEFIEAGASRLKVCLKSRQKISQTIVRPRNVFGFK
jgi:hypothetical protein